LEHKHILCKTIKIDLKTTCEAMKDSHVLIDTKL